MAERFKETTAAPTRTQTHQARIRIQTPTIRTLYTEGERPEHVRDLRGVMIHPLVVEVTHLRVKDMVRLAGGPFPRTLTRLACRGHSSPLRRRPSSPSVSRSRSSPTPTLRRGGRLSDAWAQVSRRSCTQRSIDYWPFRDW